jgi:DNA-binding protein HU-beta
MNKNDLIAATGERAGFSRSDTEKVVDALLETILQVLKSGGEVRLVGFGTFEVTTRRAGQGRNPRTGEKIEIGSTRTPKFRPGKQLKDAVNMAG